MNSVLLNQLKYFKRVNVPKYVEVRLQKTALIHLDLPDMGKLRDRMEGQLYYDRLKTDIFAEYAFENIIGLRKFDWNKRDNKDYVRKKYVFDNKKLTIITFVGDYLPKFSSEHINNCIFIFVNSGNRVLVSGLATSSKMKEIMIKQNSKVIEVNDFKELINYSTVDELLIKMD